MHQLAVRISYARAIETIARALFANLKILGGVAILEDKTNRFRRVEAVSQQDVFAREPELLEESRQYHAMLPFTQLDVLLVDEIVEQSDKSIVCRKTFHPDEYFFQGHYPGYPLVPGVILCESAMQAVAKR